jgi:hypothetical protein
MYVYAIRKEKGWKCNVFGNGSCSIYFIKDGYREHCSRLY